MSQLQINWEYLNSDANYSYFKYLYFSNLFLCADLLEIHANLNTKIYCKYIAVIDSSARSKEYTTYGKAKNKGQGRDDPASRRTYSSLFKMV